MKEAGVFIVTIGVGPYINDNELRSIASSPEFYLKVDSYEELNEDAIVKQVTNLTCNELPPCPNKKLADYLQAHEGRVRRTSPIFPQSVKQVCEGIPVDLLFIVDQSTSLGEESFRKELNFINSIITNIDSNLLHVSVIKFSDEANIEIRFNQYQSMQDLTRAVSSIYYGGGNTYTNKALYLMLKEGFSDTNGARPGVDKIGIVITDGGSTDPISTKTMALKVQQEGIQMFAIGVGPEFASNERNNQEELNSIASDPDKDFVFTVDDADGLENIHNMISRKVCEDKCKDTYGSRTQVQNALAAIPYSTGDTNMHLAFEKMLNEEFSGARGARNVDKIAVVLTDGNPTDRYKLADQVKEAKARGITIFTVGIGPDVNVNRLNEIASEPSQYYSFSVSSLDTLSQIRRQMGLRICALNGYAIYTCKLIKK
ncbi:hypothetical protein KUTeg_009457 [Tegillarca granosa]|uniref:VWFA domain-containing protein n=1 Tax=Tegillarca granosa TaxID=220873 RepID=A0ABQ9F3X4_TEGGR|nr:hypothetical protein KUTeg_009457 [Tegillarca granosa]